MQRKATPQNHRFCGPTSTASVSPGNSGNGNVAPEPTPQELQELEAAKILEREMRTFTRTRGANRIQFRAALLQFMAVGQ